MRGLGDKDRIFTADDLSEIDMGHLRPTRMPAMADGHALICGYDQGRGEHMILCETIEDAQKLFDGYARGGANRIRWYTGVDPESVPALKPGGS